MPLLMRHSMPKVFFTTLSTCDAILGIKYLHPQVPQFYSTPQVPIVHCEPTSLRSVPVGNVWVPWGHEWRFTNASSLFSYPGPFQVTNAWLVWPVYTTQCLGDWHDGFYSYCGVVDMFCHVGTQFVAISEWLSGISWFNYTLPLDGFCFYLSILAVHNIFDVNCSGHK